MQINLEEKSKELKTFVSQFETPMFLGDINTLMNFIGTGKAMESLKGLSSPLRQLYYVAGLNVTSAPPADRSLKPQYSQEEWTVIKKLLNEIEMGYQQFFYPKPEDTVDDVWKQKRQVAMPSFLSYFNQGPMNYEEQVIERIEQHFTPFNAAVLTNFGLEVKDFIEIYNFLDEWSHQKLNSFIGNKEGEQTWEQFCDEMKEKEIMPPDWHLHFTKHIRDGFDFMYDKGKIVRYTPDDLIPDFGDQKAALFFSIFTCERSESNFLYYSEPNILHLKPFFKVDEQNYQVIEIKQILHAIYNSLFQFCISQAAIKDKFYKHRGEILEEKIKSVFSNFFKGNGFTYHNYFTQERHEQDILITVDGLALIIEAKASKRDEPLREPDKAYPLILSNFDETIQKGYDQAYRVKSKFIDKEELQIYNDLQLKKHLYAARTKNYHHAFSLIITYERFGQIQTDLSELLEIYDDDEFPWSICIDDLEVFLLALVKKGKKTGEFIRFLITRQQLHGKLICGDELEVCGAFLNNKIDLQKIRGKEIIITTPDLADVFDEIYFKGLGFENEKNLDRKTSGKYLILG